MSEKIRFFTENKKYENIELRWNRDTGTIEMIQYTNKYHGFIENSWDFERK